MFHARGSMVEELKNCKLHRLDPNDHGTTVRRTPTSHSLHSRSIVTMSSSKGINIQDALNILAQRPQTHDHEHCHHSDDHRPSMATRGQVIELMASVDEESQGEAKQEETPPSQTMSTEERKQKLQAKLSSLSIPELLRLLLSTQEHRVQTYKTFDLGLVEILNSDKNLSLYPSHCAQVTAAFAVASDTINAIRSVLVQEKRQQSTTVVVSLLDQLQALEAQKLQVTAAWHLERIRLETDPNDALLAQGADELHTKILGLVEPINELLDEIRMEALAEQE